MKKAPIALLIGLGFLALLVVPWFTLRVKIDLPPATHAASAQSVSPGWLWGWLIYLAATTVLAGVTVVRWIRKLVSYLRNRRRTP